MKMPHVKVLDAPKSALNGAAEQFTVVGRRAGPARRGAPETSRATDSTIDPVGVAPTELARQRLQIVVLGLSLTSSWGNGHATTYRGLLREVAARGHQVRFLERDQEWYASNRDMPEPPFCSVALYTSFQDLRERFSHEIRNADLVIVGSYVAEGAAIGEWVTKTAQGVKAFYDIDTPVTLSRLEGGRLDYLTPGLVPRYDLYLSFTGGPTLRRLEKRFGSPMARPLYCSVDSRLYYPERPERRARASAPYQEQRPIRWDLGYMGTYSADRQPALDELLVRPAECWDTGRFVVAGPQYPKSIHWPRNIKRYVHLPPARHRAFYNSQRFTLNITRADMVEAGYSPSVRLFEAAACGTPIISDLWPGLDSFFEINNEILVTESSEETLYYVLEISEDERQRIGEQARRRVLSKHTAKHRALELEGYVLNVLGVSAQETAVRT